MIPTPRQAEVIAHRGGNLLVRGAAGTGKTTAALALVAARVAEGLDVDRVLFLTPTRRGAARLRDELSARLSTTTGRPLVRTPASAAFAVLRLRAAHLGEAAPVLISGPEQDLVLADLLAGHREGVGAAVPWPDTVPAETLALRSFRDELRDLLMRAAERGLGPSDLARLGREHRRPEWQAAAVVYEEYLDVTALQSGTPDVGARFDPAVIVDEAAAALADWGAPLPPPPSWDLVVVDDYQEATAATARLLHVLGERAELVLLADPDAAVQTFRGALPALVERAVVAPAGSELGAFAAAELVLDRVLRHGPAIRGAVRAVTDVIRGPGRSQRAAEAAPQPGTAEVHLLPSQAQQAAFISHTLRAAHLHQELDWHRMAVVVRSGEQVVSLRRALLDAQVPVAVLGGDVPLASEPAVRPLLRALEAVSAELTPATAAELLTSPLGGLDAVGLRRLRRALRAAELADGGCRGSDELLVAALHRPELVPALPFRQGVRRLGRVLAAGRDAMGPGATALEVLWALWSAAQLAESWRRTALAGGPAGARADRDLDAVLALMAAAERFADRMPRAPVRAFLDHLAAQQVPEDTLAAHGDLEHGVALLTAAGAAGREWDLVIVAGVQEGSWPDLRLRDRLLGAGQLVDVVSGRTVPGADADEQYRQARAAVLDDELRSFAVAISRARDRLVVTAVLDEEQRPSPFVDLVDPGPAGDEVDPRVVQVPASLDLRGLVARCRAELVADPRPDHPAAGVLARLAAAGVAGADPDEWYGLAELSTSEPPWPADGPVPLSPSRLEVAATCGLRWALESAGGHAADSLDQSLGTLLHAAAALHPDGDVAALTAAVEQSWDDLGLPDTWVSDSQRRRAAGMVAHLAEYLREHETVAVEQSFTVDLGRVRLRGKVDRLERDGDGLRVVDLKTGRSPVSVADAQIHPQLGAYQLAVAAGAFGEEAAPSGAALVYVGTQNRNYVERAQAPLAEHPDPQWARELVERVAEIATSPVVAATGNQLCRSCPVRRCCPLQPEGGVVA